MWWPTSRWFEPSRMAQRSFDSPWTVRGNLPLLEIAMLDNRPVAPQTGGLIVGVMTSGDIFHSPKSVERARSRSRAGQPLALLSTAACGPMGPVSKGAG